MPRFSEREGIRPPKNVIQIESMDNPLRYGLWNALSECYWTIERGGWSAYSGPPDLSAAIWRDYFQLPVDDIPHPWGPYIMEVRRYFMGADWFDVYEFIEFVANFSSRTDPRYFELSAPFRRYCNTVMERELSAWRFVGGLITRLTSEQEIKAVEDALEDTRRASPLAGVSLHLEQAQALLADRKAPDYRNSIKESISAIEALCKLIVGDDQTTLGAALNRIEADRKITLHKNVKEAFSHLYKYTSDADGIRHALKDAPTVDLPDALYMLVTCSAFVNYLLARVAEAGIQLS